MKRLKPGQIFTMYGIKWRVQKHQWAFPCSTCELHEYWQKRATNMTMKEFISPCFVMCRTKFILPNNCSAKMIVKNEKSRRPLFKYVW